MNKLSHPELGRLYALETVIKKGQQSFVEVGLALLEIRDKKLYREKHETFDEYCEKRWGWKRSRTYQLMDAASVVEALPKKMSTIVDTESKARELKKIPASKRVEVLEIVHESKVPVTAKAIKETHEKNSHPVPPRAASNGSPDKKQEPAILDKTGYPIPEKALAYWERRHEVEELIAGAGAIKSIVTKAWNDGDKPDPLLFGKGKLTQTFITDIENIIRHLKSALPHAVCPYCQGRFPETCAYCNKTGMVSSTLLNAAPEELLKVREKSCKK